MNPFITIHGQNLTVEVNRTEPYRNLCALGNTIYCLNKVVLAKFDTPERTFEVWQQLKKAALEGADSFTIPKE